MTNYRERLEKIAEFDENDKTLEAQFRGAVWPDADKDGLNTFQADWSCYGFNVGRDAESERLAPLIKLLIDDNERLRKALTSLCFDNGEHDMTVEKFLEGK